MTRDMEHFVVQESPNDLTDQAIVPNPVSSNDVDRARAVVAANATSVEDAKALLQMIGILDPVAVQFRTEE